MLLRHVFVIFYTPLLIEYKTPFHCIYLAYVCYRSQDITISEYIYIYIYIYDILYYIIQYHEIIISQYDKITSQ